jgi:hypothetical protein
MRQGTMTPEELRRYAETIIRGCIAFRRGDTLLALADLGHRELAVALAEVAYRCGAAAVDVSYTDNRVFAAKLEHAPDASIGHQTPWKAAQWRALAEETVALVQLMGEFEQDVVAHLQPERVAAETAGRSRYLARVRREGRRAGRSAPGRRTSGPRASSRGWSRSARSGSSRRSSSGSAASARTTRPATLAGRSISPRSATGRHG